MATCAAEWFLSVKVLFSPVDKGIGSVETFKDMKQAASKHWNQEAGKAGVPMPGLNDNLDFMGKQLHVQTEIVGFPVACIVTQVFCKGKVILSRKLECPSGSREICDVDKMRELMNAQHFHIMQNIADKQVCLLGSQ
jgi:hypothetical protein